jgi:integrase
MATANLTDKSVRAKKAKAGQRIELWDSASPGLCLRVSGVADADQVRQRKVWVFRYRTDDGRQPRFTLGMLTAKQGVKWARGKAEEHRVAVRQGADPSGERRRKRLEARRRDIRTFDDMARAYLAACRAGDWMPKGRRQSERTLSGFENILKNHIQPELGDLRIEDLTRARVRQFLRDMRGKGIGTQVNRAQAFVRQAFSWVIAEYEGKVASVNPALGNAIVPETPRSRVLSDAELKSLWLALGTPSALRIKAEGEKGEGRRVYISRSVAIALQLAMLLLQRRGEISGMMLSEVNLAQKAWLIDAPRMKGRRQHLVPLPPYAVDLIEEAIRLGDGARRAKIKALRENEQPTPSDWPVFPSPRDAAKSIKADSLTHALAAILEAIGIQEATTHDLRRSGSTVLTSERLAVSPFVRSLVLSHVSSTDGGASVSREHYDANSYASEKRRALEAWEALLLEIVGERIRSSNVEPLRGVG